MRHSARARLQASMEKADIAVFTDRIDWHARALLAAFARAGVRAKPLSLTACGFAVGSAGPELVLPGFSALPLAALVRSIAAGSFEQVTKRLSILHALAASGVVVVNNARAIERCVDKAMASFLLAQAGLPTPPSWVTESLEEARAIAEREASPAAPLVLKPLFGSRGRGQTLISAAAEIPAPEAVSSVYYLQRFVGDVAGGWHDWRVFVSAGRAVAAMLRLGAGWRTNAALGARCEPAATKGPLAALAVAAANAVGVDFAGVDVIADHAGRLMVLEVNSNPAWIALQWASKRRIAPVLVADFLTRLSRRQAA